MPRSNFSPSRTSAPPAGPNSVQFPPAWLWLVDEAIPTWVKDHYSPKESWKGKPFSELDAHFFFKGIEELSELFTEERPSQLPAYFRHPKFRSAYLLYFLPLQGSKFVTLLQLHRKAMEAALEHGKSQGVLRIADLGSGPGTASISFLLMLLTMKLAIGEELPPVELHWVDTDAKIMADGKAIAELLASHFPKLRGKVTIQTHVAPWWKAPKLIPGPTSLIFMGNVLNESYSKIPRSMRQALELEKEQESSEAIELDSPEVSQQELPEDPEEESDTQTASPRGLSIEAEAQLRALSELTSRMSGGGLLLVEPAFKRPSQQLSTLRDFLFEKEILPREATSIWGPCLHAERCPLASGRDWCHFSVPVSIPGDWFKRFSKGLGSERQWVKFSYLWFAAPEHPAPKPSGHLRRVVSDPLQKTGIRNATVLICEPETPARHSFPAAQRVRRGDLIPLKKPSKR